jgi:hypothetical protein
MEMAGQFCVEINTGSWRESLPTGTFHDRRTFLQKNCKRNLRPQKSQDHVRACLVWGLPPAVRLISRAYLVMCSQSRLARLSIAS